MVAVIPAPNPDFGRHVPQEGKQLQAAVGRQADSRRQATAGRQKCRSVPAVFCQRPTLVGTKKAVLMTMRIQSDGQMA